MIHTTLIDAETLATSIDDCVTVDCRHDLMDPTALSSVGKDDHTHL